MATAHDRVRSSEETQARENLMREQFERDREAWEDAVPVETFLEELDTRIQSKESAKGESTKRNG